MLIWKLVGAGCMVCCGVCAGTLFSGRLKRRVRSLLELRGFFTGMRASMQYTAAPMEQLVWEAVTPDSPPWLSEALSSLRMGEPFPAAFGSAVERFACDSALTREDVRTVQRLVSRLGTTDANGENALLTLGLTELETRLAAAEQDAARRCRLFRSLGLLGGVLCAVLLM